MSVELFTEPTAVIGLVVTDWTAVIVSGAFLLVLLVGIIVGCVLLVRGVQDQRRYNSTTLPSLDKEEGEEETESADPVFDLSTPVEDEYEDEGYESDKWFALSRDIDDEELEDIRRRRSARRSDNFDDLLE